MRYHPLTEDNTSVVIMRNCSHNMTPLDIIIQNYWIVSTDKEFMEYVDITYGFVARSYLTQKQYLYKTLYNKTSNSKHTRSKKIKHFNYDRTMAGLFSCRLKANNTYYKTMFMQLYNKLSNNNENITNYLKFEYGIDEAITQFIFPTLRIATYRYRDKPNNPGNLKQHTFAIKIENSYDNSSCNKCDRETLKTLKTFTADDKYKSNCDMKNYHNCILYDIYKDDKDKYNMPEYSYNKLHVLSELKYLRALPFVNLNINTWQVNRLSFMLTLSSIMFKNKYTFALKTNTKYRYNKYMPYYIKDSEKKKSNKSNKSNKEILNKEKTKKNGNPVIKSIEKIYDEDDNPILKDPYLVLCSLAKKDMDVDKYIKNISIAYNENNYYPVVIYPKTLTILNYNDKNDTILFKPLLEPISNKHNMNFIT